MNVKDLNMIEFVGTNR